jgi:hypothetical protein
MSLAGRPEKSSVEVHKPASRMTRGSRGEPASSPSSGKRSGGVGGDTDGVELEEPEVDCDELDA